MLTIQPQYQPKKNRVIPLLFFSHSTIRIDTIRTSVIMSTAEETKPDASAEPETTKDTNATETAATPSATQENPAVKSEQPSYTEMATAATTSATSAAVGVKDSVFSMFGGGAKKEKKEDDEAQDRSGSSKAQKEAEQEGDDPEVIYAYMLASDTAADAI